jgi:predicted RNase H-like HicB family nuclease
MEKTLQSNNVTFTIIVEQSPDGYFAECRELQGCYAEGATYEEVMANIKEVVELHIEDRIERGDRSVLSDTANQVSLTTFSVPVAAYVTETNTI